MIRGFFKNGTGFTNAHFISEEIGIDVAIELYKKKEVSLARAAEICGLDIEDFKDLLKERNIKISVPSIPIEEIDKEVEKILEIA